MPQTSSRLRAVWHIVHNCECRHASTWREAVDELDALERENSELREALRNACEEWEAWMEKGMDVEEPQPDDRKALAGARAVLKRG